MKKTKDHLTMIAVGLTLMLAVMVLTLLAFPAGAAPDRQDIPTPTLFPSENTPYTLETVGGEDTTLIFPGIEIEGFTLGETSVQSVYPRGMIFSVTAESEGGEIQDVILFIRFTHGSGTRVVADYDPDTEAWIAHPWETGDGRPAWSHFDFYWRVRDAAGNSIDTDPIPLDYWDPTREWFRAESEHSVIYWFGFGEDITDEIAQKMADRLAGTYPRWEAGFGRALPYKPIAVIYPTREALAEIYGSGIVSNRVAGFTSSDLGMSVQILRDTSIPPGNDTCIWARQPEDWTMELRIGTIYGVTAHEFTHLVQYEVLGDAFGPEWWSEGQPEWFANTSRNYDERLHHLATLQDLPSLTTEIGSDLTQEDGCTALSYNVGPSFINFLLTNYGGIETHRKIVDLMRANKTVYDAIEEVTGKPFLEVENEWRTYLGFPALDLAQVDPASALQPAIDPVAAEGETVTLPATPALSPIYEKPGPRVIASGQCFANTPVTILQVGSLDGVDYYQVDCMGQVGWMSRDQLVGPGQ